MSLHALLAKISEDPPVWRTLCGRMRRSTHSLTDAPSCATCRNRIRAQGHLGQKPEEIWPHPVGTPVLYRVKGRQLETSTRSAAKRKDGHWVIYLEQLANPVALSRVVPR